MRFETSGAARVVEVRIGTTGLLSLRDSAAAQIGSTTQLSTDTWYRIELYFKVVTGGGANSTADLRLDGLSVASSTTADLGSTAPTRYHVGRAVGTDASADVYVDDVALNDSAGSDENSWCGPGKIVLLRPVSDYQRDAGWLNGASGTTNLYDALDNTPPVGVALGSATATSQIRNAAAVDSEAYFATTATYASAGITASDRVKVVQAATAIGSSGTTARGMGLKLDNNPVGGVNDSLFTSTTTAGTYPTGWNAWRGPSSYVPSLTLSAGARVRLRNYALADEVTACLLGVYVEYEPSQLGAATLAGDSSLDAVGIGAKFGSAAVSGDGALAADGIRNMLGSSALSGESDFTAAGIRSLWGAAALSGEGVLSGDAIRSFFAAAALSGEGTLDAAAIRTMLGSAALSGEGVLSADSLRLTWASAALAGEGMLDVSGVRNLLGAAALSGESSLTVDAFRMLYGAAVLAGEGILSADAQRLMWASASLDGSGDLTAVGIRSLFASAALSGDGSLVAAGIRNLLGSAALSGEGTLSAAAIRNILAAALLAGEGTLTADSLKRSWAAAVLTGTGTFTAAGTRISDISADLFSASSLGRATLGRASLGRTTE